VRPYQYRITVAWHHGFFLPTPAPLIVPPGGPVGNGLSQCQMALKSERFPYRTSRICQKYIRLSVEDQMRHQIDRSSPHLFPPSWPWANSRFSNPNSEFRNWWVYRIAFEKEKELADRRMKLAEVDRNKIEMGISGAIGVGHSKSPWMTQIE